MMLALQERGCHNINLVTPEHVVPQILEVLLIAARRGLRLPLVYNMGAYDSLESLRFMDGVVDIYMPDLKFWDREMARRYLRAPDYPEAARQAIREMHLQVGPLVINNEGVAIRGLLLRHLVMPDDICGTGEIMRWVARERVAVFVPADVLSRPTRAPPCLAEGGSFEADECLAFPFWEPPRAEQGLYPVSPRNTDRWRRVLDRGWKCRGNRAARDRSRKLPDARNLQRCE
jgi:hypothetical protein